MSDIPDTGLAAEKNDWLLHLTFGEFVLLSYGMGAIAAFALVLPFIIFECIFK